MCQITCINELYWDTVPPGQGRKMIILMNLMVNEFEFDRDGDNAGWPIHINWPGLRTGGCTFVTCGLNVVFFEVIKFWRVGIQDSFFYYLY